MSHDSTAGLVFRGCPRSAGAVPDLPDKYLRDKPYRVYKEVALNRVIDASRAELDARAWNYYTRASLDFVVSEANLPHPWELAIEFDSAYHDSDEGRVKDQLKNRICLDGGLPLIRLRSDHLVDRAGVSFLQFMLDLYFAEKELRELVELGEIAPDEEYFPSSGFYGTTRLRRKLEQSGILSPALLCTLPVQDPSACLWYRIGTGSFDQAWRKPDWRIGSASVEILRGWNGPTSTLLSVERKAYLHECAPNRDVYGVHGWFIANELALFLCFQETIRKLDRVFPRCQRET